MKSHSARRQARKREENRSCHCLLYHYHSVITMDLKTCVVENEEVPAAVAKEFVLLGSSHFRPDLLQENGSSCFHPLDFFFLSFFFSL